MIPGKRRLQAARNHSAVHPCVRKQRQVVRKRTSRCQATSTRSIAGAASGSSRIDPGTKADSSALLPSLLLKRAARSRERRNR
jgi:hypothetical protein